jgi:hypothetical protein
VEQNETDSDSESESESESKEQDEQLQQQQTFVAEKEKEVELFKLLQQEEEEDPRIKDLFTKEITWRPFAFTEKHGETDNDAPYHEACPNGGPGGMICCDACSQKYSLFLSQTMEDLETSRMRMETAEVKELMQLLEGSEKALAEAVDEVAAVEELEGTSVGRVSGTRNGRSKIYYL